MNQKAVRALDLIEKRRNTLRLLGNELMEGRQAFIELNLEAIHEQIAQQEQLCSEIRQVDNELAGLMLDLKAELPADAPSRGLEALEYQLDPASLERLRSLVEDLDKVQADVRRLNRIHAELLRRSRGSINMLLNLVTNCMGTYQAPQGPPAVLLLPDNVG